MKALGFSPEDIEDLDVEPGLGDGGLGRLAACLLDSMATLDIPAVGWTRMSVLNTARSGFFSSDRTVTEYCSTIWKAGPVWLGDGAAE